MNRFIVAIAVLAVALVAAFKPDTANATAFNLSFTERCYGWGADVKLRWEGMSPGTTQYVDVSRYDNGWLAGTFESSGALAANAETYTVVHLHPDVAYMVRISQFGNGNWQFSENFIIRPCASIAAQRAGLMASNSPNKPNTSCGPNCAMAWNTPLTYP
jgi:hypothetical protein